MLHSGSRGVGNRIGMHFIEKTKKDMERWHIHLPDSDLAYLPEGSENFEGYIEAVEWAQNFSRVNLEVMMARVIAAVRQVMGIEFEARQEAVNCHHNYVSIEKVMEVQNDLIEVVYTCKAGCVCQGLKVPEVNLGQLIDYLVTGIVATLSALLNVIQLFNCVKSSGLSVPAYCFSCRVFTIKS